MKNLLLLIVPFLFFVTSCDKTKRTVCPAKTCEYGMNPATCDCNPKPTDPVDPNDTTGNGNGNGNGNGGNDTTTTPIVSVFGNGSNGTYDTTTNFLSNKTQDQLQENQYQLLYDIFTNTNTDINVIHQKEELLKNGTLVPYIKYNNNTYSSTEYRHNFVIRDYNNVEEPNQYADIVLGFTTQQFNNFVLMFNETNKTFFVNPASEPETFGEYNAVFSDVNNTNIKNAKLTIKVLNKTNGYYVYFNKITFKIGNDNYEYRAVYTGN